MAGPAGTIPTRLIERFTVRRTDHGFAITESKRAWWIAYALVWVVIVGLGYVYTRDSPPGDEIAQRVVLLVVCVAMFIWIVFLAYHVRVVVDRREEACFLQRRLLLLTIHSRRLPLRGARLFMGDVPVRHRHNPAVETFEPIGCLLFFLGPLGNLIDGVRILRSAQITTRLAPGLGYQSAGNDPIALFAMSPQGRFDSDALIDVAGDLIPPVYHRIPLPHDPAKSLGLQARHER